MITIGRITHALQQAHISCEEQCAWLDLIPFLSPDACETLLTSFEREATALAAARATHLARVQTIVDRAAARRAVTALD